LESGRHYINFDRYRFNPVSTQLWNEEGEIKLTRKAAAVLAVLVGRAGQPVTKKELFASVWANTVVTDDALTTCVQEIRKALGDDAKQPRYIETRHRSGYQFIADVAQPVAAIVPQDAAAIAVLPFSDMSPERDQDFFCEGLAEELIDALTHVDGLRVAARTSSFQFRDAEDVREIGRRLGVSALLEGSVRKAGDRLRITVQLIDVATGYHKWSQRFERELGDVFAIQDEIAQRVATILRGGDLSSRERRGLKRQHTAGATYEYFLRGRQCLHRLQVTDLEQSRQMFERAIELDANYAPAWAGLASVHATLYEWFGAKDDELQRADEASKRAMELSPDLADAHVARGFVMSLRRQYDEAQSHFESAARINPHLFDAYYYFGRMSFERGQIERSAELFLKAAEVRQEDFQSLYLGGQSLDMSGRKEEARAIIRASIVRAERILALNPLDARTLSLGGGALFEDGQIERAMEWTRRSLELYPDDMGGIFNAACMHCKLGQKEEALQLLERAVNRGWGRRDWIERDTDYDILRDDPRFIALMSKLK
jgi:adenylate cyclase